MKMRKATVMNDPSAKMINLYNRVKNNPELLELLESAKDLKQNDIDYLIELIEYKKHKESDAAEKGRKTRYQLFRRIDIDWNKLHEAITSKGYSYNSLAEKIGISHSVLCYSKKDGKMNPFLLEEVCDVLNVKAEDYCNNLDYVRLRNGKSVSNRIRVNWDMISDDAKRMGINMTKLSKAINRSPGYLNSCKRSGGLYEDVLQQIGIILNRDYKDYCINESTISRDLINSICDQYDIK